MNPATATAADYKVADISLAPFGRKEIELAEHDVGLSDVAFAARLRSDERLRAATETWLEAEAERPADVPVPDWLRWEQEKHQRLLTTPTPLTEVA